MSEMEVLEAALNAGESIGIPVGIAVLLQDPFKKLVGPTADYLGESLRDFVKDPRNRQIAANLVKTITVAIDRLGDKIQEPGQIPLRVARTILTEAAYSESEIVTQYLGGVLASARTPDGRDDRGVKIAEIVTSLSTYQLRAHYLIYSTIPHLFSSPLYSFKRTYIFEGFRMGYLGKRFIEAMDMTESEQKNHQIWSHIFDGLIREHLIAGDAISLLQHHHMPEGRTPRFVNDVDLICQPTPLGAELFLWVFGHSDKDLDFIFSQAFEIDGLPAFIPDAKAISLN